MLNSDERALVWLNSFNISIKKKNHVLENFMSPTEFYDEFLESKELLVDILGEKNYSIMKGVHNDEYIDYIIEKMTSKGVFVTTISSENYPKILLDTLLDDAPIVLYYVGDLSLVDNRCIAIVGTRRVTRYGRDVTKKFARELSLEGFTIVSGLARGVDSIAHAECLENEGKTIAVLGSGIDIVYPRENLGLYKEIAEKGLILSEFPLGTEPQPYNFPLRNRIIVALSSSVLVTEASEKSGSMISSNLAMDYNRDLFCVPGSIFSEQSEGTNSLIKNYDSVYMTLSVNDILTHYDIKPRQIVKDAVQLDFNEQAIVNELSIGKLHFEELLSKSNIEVGTLLMILTGLEVNKVIRKLPGNFYELLPN